MALRVPKSCGLCLLLLVSHVSLGCRKQSSPPQVTIRGTTWTVELAVSEQQRARGLGGRDGLAEDAGMLFVFPHPKVLKFCMRGCRIDLDVAFISPEMRVVKIYTMVTEPDQRGRVTYSSEIPAQYALEVRAGSLQRLGIKVGDEVTFSGDIPVPAKAQADP